MSKRQWTLARVAEGVERLVRKFGVAPWMQRVLEWRRDWDAADERVAEFERACQEYISQAVDSGRLFIRKPRKGVRGRSKPCRSLKGWYDPARGKAEADWDCRPLPTPVRVAKETVLRWRGTWGTYSVWLPPDLVNAPPRPEYPLPLPEGRDLTLPEKYVALAAVHACYWKGVPVWKRPVSDESGESWPEGFESLVWQHNLLKAAEKTPKTDARALRYILAAVRADLELALGQAPGGTSTEKPAAVNEGGREGHGGAKTSPKETHATERTRPRKAKPSEEKAYGQWKRAIELNAELNGAIDRAVYDWVGKNMLDEGESLPVFGTWRRQLSTVRSYRAERKNQPRAGRPHGKTVVRQNQI